VALPFSAIVPAVQSTHVELELALNTLLLVPPGHGSGVPVILVGHQ
jgi:hypothetical protein